MDSAPVICSLCGVINATTFTFTNWKLSFCCDNCYSGITTPISEPAHATFFLPMSFTQSYLEEMSLWVNKVKEMKERMELNLEEVDACICELRTLKETFSAYSSLLISKLMHIKDLLQERKNLALEELERTVFDPNPILSNEWSIRARNEESWKFFSYKIDQESLCKVKISCPPVESDRLVNISGNQLTMYNIKINDYSQRTIAFEFTGSVRCCFLSPQELLCIYTCNSEPFSAILDLKTHEIRYTRETPTLNADMGKPALVAANYCCYAFYLYKRETHRFNMKYDAFEDSWTSLPEISESIYDCFVSYNKGRIYIVTYFCRIQVFDICSETFEETSVTYDADENIIFSTFVGDDLVILSNRAAEIWRIGSDKTKEIKATFNCCEGRVQNSVKYQNGFIWYIDSDSGRVMQYNVATRVLASAA